MKNPSKLARIAIAALVVASLAAASTPSHAFRMIQNTSIGRVSAGYAVACNAPGGFTHWSTGAIPWRLNTSGQGAGKETVVQSATAAWTAVPSANHTLTYAGTTSAGFATDGVNTIVFANGNGCRGSCLALTALVLQSGQVIVETDITFNSHVSWQTNGSDYDTLSIATHELGHTLGIHHTEITGSPTPTMYAYYFGTAARSLENDDQSALQCSQSRYPVP